MIARPDQKVVNLKNFAENVQLELLHYWLEAIHLLEVLKKKTNKGCSPFKNKLETFEDAL